MSDYKREKKPSISLSKNKFGLETYTPNDKQISNYNPFKDKKNFLLDYVFQKESKKGLKVNSERLSDLKSRLIENKDHESLTASEVISKTLKKLKRSSKNNIIINPKNKEKEKFSSNSSKKDNSNFNNINFSNKDPSSSNKLSSIQNSFKNTKLSSLQNSLGSSIPEIKNILNQKSNCLNSDFSTQSKRFKDKKQTNVKYKLSEMISSNNNCLTNENNSENRNENVLDTKSLNYVTTSKPNYINMKPNFSYENPVAISQIKNIVLSQTLGKIKKNPHQKEAENCVVNDNINFYEVNIGKYLNFNKDNANYLDINNLNSNSIVNLNSNSEDHKTPQSQKVDKKVSSLNKSNQSTTFKSHLAKNSLKNSFSNLINCNNIENPEELHFASVLFYINNKVVSKNFDKEFDFSHVKTKPKHSNHISVKILEEEIEL